MTNKAKGIAVKKDKKRALKPKLRFPEFRDAPGWGKKRLGGLFSKRDETGLAELRLLSLTDKEGIIPQESTNRKNNSNSDKSKYLRVVPGDIAYNTMRMWEGRSAFVDMEGLISPAYTVCEPNDGVDALCFSYYFKTPQLVEQFRRYSQGLVKDTLNLKFDAFARIVVPSPSAAEQSKIAACLSSLDELIGAHRRKLDALKAYKKGLMQQLFPREGETLPRLRFPEFQTAPEWEEMSLGSLVDFQSGGTPSKANRDYWNGSFPWISAKDMKQLFLDDSQDHITTAAVEDGARQVPAGTVLMLTRGMTLLNDVPICILRRAMSYNQDVKALREKGVLDRSFVPYLMLGNKQRLLSMVDIAGHGTGRLNTEELKSLIVKIPPRTEQKRIAEFLFSLEAIIPVHSQKLDALKTHKNGLMQQLFPSPEDSCA